MGRVFNTLEEAMEVWRKERENALVKRGILCQCECYRREDDIRSTSPLCRCLVLISEEVYEDYVKWTSGRYKDPDYKFPFVAVLAPGVIRVRFGGNQRDDYATKTNLCENRFLVEELLQRHLGKKVRLGRNVLVR